MAKVRCVWLRAKKTSQSASAQSFELLDAEGSPAVVSGSELLALRHARATTSSRRGGLERLRFVVRDVVGAAHEGIDGAHCVALMARQNAKAQ